jgi:hypothetical protein
MVEPPAPHVSVAPAPVEPEEAAEPRVVWLPVTTSSYDTGLEANLAAMNARTAALVARAGPMPAVRQICELDERGRPTRAYPPPPPPEGLMVPGLINKRGFPTIILQPRRCEQGESRGAGRAHGRFGRRTLYEAAF